MAEIGIERRPRRKLWPWLLALVLIVVAVVAFWAWYSGGLGTKPAPADDVTAPAGARHPGAEGAPGGAGVPARPGVAGRCPRGEQAPP